MKAKLDFLSIAYHFELLSLKLTRKSVLCNGTILYHNWWRLYKCAGGKTCKRKKSTIMSRYFLQVENIL